MQKSLESIHKSITTCNQCPRLRKYCEKIAEVKRRAFLSETYCGKPITGFGDPHARLMIVGLAPAAHGANRTGRIFTGDRSGDWLYRALFKAGFANQPTSTHAHDGLELKDTYISCVVKCAPPDNKPEPSEQEKCSAFLKQELQSLKQVQVWIALGQIALNGIWPLIGGGERKPKFKHGAEIPLGLNRHLILSYHPSQQNTFTGKLTEPMFDSIFEKARKQIYGDSSIS
jgi:uracil-DNA glycosylase family 4